MPVTGRVTGHVTRSSLRWRRPETQAACRFHPAPGVALAFEQAASGDISFATADASGAYAVTLPPGDYFVTYKNPTALGPISGSAGPRLVTVNAGKTVVADFSYTLQLL